MRKGRVECEKGVYGESAERRGVWGHRVLEVVAQGGDEQREALLVCEDVEHAALQAEVVDGLSPITAVRIRPPTPPPITAVKTQPRKLHQQNTDDLPISQS
jgi:hypothetical protein